VNRIARTAGITALALIGVVVLAEAAAAWVVSEVMKAIEEAEAEA
jgi:hypothetical protein